MIEILKIKDHSYLISDEEPQDRDFCITYHKTTGPGLDDCYYQEDADYYVFKPKSIISSTNPIVNRRLNIPELGETKYEER